MQLSFECVGKRLSITLLIIWKIYSECPKELNFGLKGIINEVLIKTK